VTPKPAPPDICINPLLENGEFLRVAVTDARTAKDVDEPRSSTRSPTLRLVI